MRLYNSEALQKCSLVPIHPTMYLFVKSSAAKLQLGLLSLSFLQVHLKTIAEFQDRHLISPFMCLQSNALERLVLLALY